MKRKIKNIVIIVIIIIMGISSYFTINFASQNSANSQKDMMEQGKMQGMQSKESSGDNQSEPPAKPDGEGSGNQSEPPAKPDGEGSGNQSELPAKPDGEGSGNQSEPPAKPDGEGSGNQSEPPAKPDGEESGNQSEPPTRPDGKEKSTKIKTVYYILFGIEGLVISALMVYLIMSKFNKKTVKDTFKGAKRIILYIVFVVTITAGLTLLEVYIANNILGHNYEGQDKNNSMKLQGNVSTANIEYTSEVEVNGNETLSSSYTSEEKDKSVILVKDGANLILDGASVIKSGGDCSNTENSEFYGVNAGILVTKNSTATIKDTTISTNAKGANAVFSTGENSKIYISNSTIASTAEGSARGLDATYGGYIEADNVTITTNGGSCATLATDRGEGTVIAKNSKLETNGSGSPVIYSTGNISIENTSGIANGSQMVVVEGKNTATVKNSTLSAAGKGNRGETDVCGIMIYQSMSGDASEGTGTLNCTDSTLSVLESSSYYKTAPMFFITNTDAVINLQNTKLVYGSNILLSAKETNQWGKSGQNGGNVTLNATNQELNGNIELDNISKLVMNLTKSSYEGTINANNSAKSIDLKLDDTSNIKLTGDSYVTSLEDADTSYSNIDFNGYKLYVNGTAIN